MEAQRTEVLGNFFEGIDFRLEQLSVARDGRIPVPFTAVSRVYGRQWRHLNPDGKSFVLGLKEAGFPMILDVRSGRTLLLPRAALKSVRRPSDPFELAVLFNSPEAALPHIPRELLFRTIRRFDPSIFDVSKAPMDVVELRAAGSLVGVARISEPFAGIPELEALVES